MRFIHKITIVTIKRPEHADINEGLLYFGDSLGLFGLRDKDKSCYRLFVELLKAAKSQIGLSSDDLAERLKLSRGTVVHHLNKLIDSGIAVVVNNRYYLKEENLKAVIETMKKDVDKHLNELHGLAAEIDHWVGI